MSLLPRLLSDPVARALESFPVLSVVGARQTGKSTLVRSLLPPPPRTYVTLDNVETLERAREEPDSLLGSADRITLDEIQRSPELLLAVKRAVDRGGRVPGRFVLTGSANLLLLERVAETLAGRAIHFTLWPLTRRERHGQACAGLWSRLFEADETDWITIIESQPELREDWRDVAALGGYPTPAHELAGAEARSLWHAGYAQTYLERDLRALTSVASIVDFRRLMRACCLRLGNLVNQTELGRDVGLSQTTVRRHLDLLEVSYQLVRVPAYAVNRTKRLIKTPKLYWSDTALALHLAGEHEPRGAHLENLVLCDLLAWSGATPDPPDILYWRTASGQEVDFVIEWRGRVLPVEIMASRGARVADVKTLRVFRSEYGDLARGALLLHDGDELAWIADGVLAAPWWRIV